jgi:hypothetical protein
MLLSCRVPAEVPMSGLQPNKAKKKKRAHEDHLTLKRVKLDSAGGTSKKTIQFENTLSIPIQQALSKFREASEQELIRLRNEGMNPSAAINKLVDKMRTTDDDLPPCFSRQELELVMEIAGVNEEGATRALILKSELSKLRHDGFNHPEAINELSRRMKRLAGSKRRGVLPLERVEGKHRRKGSISSSRVSFTQLDSLSPMHSLDPQQLASRKRIPDTLMLDDEQYNLLRKRHKYDRDLSDSEDGSEEEQYHFDDVGEFSQDEKELGRGDEGDSEDVNSPEDIPLHAPFIDFSPSSSDEDATYKDIGEEGEGLDHEDRDTAIHDWLGDRGILFHAVKEEESDSEDTWQLPSAHSRTSSSTFTPTTTTSTLTPTTPTFTTTTPAASTSITATPFATLLPSFFSTSSIQPPLTRTPKTTKRRDSPPSTASSRVISHRSIS